jgi:two-component system, LytTR family, sensor kinase
VKEIFNFWLLLQDECSHPIIIRIMKKLVFQLKRLLRDSLILLVVGLSTTLIFSGIALFHDWKSLLGSAAYSLSIGLILWRGIAMVGIIVEKFQPAKQSPEKNLAMHMAAVLLYSSMAILLANIFIYRWIFGYNLLDNIQGFTIIGIIQLFIVIIITGVHYVLDFLRSLRQAIKEQEALKREALHHKYEALKNQMSPHFLFNSLSVLSALVELDKVRSQTFIKQLSDVYRYVLEQKGEELVSLEKEMEFVKAYIYLNQIRHDNSLKVEINILNLKGYVIPMSVQLLVENALKHNEASENKPLTLSLSRTEDDTLIVSNTYQPKKGIAGGGLGLSLLKKRCDYLFGREISILHQNGHYIVKLPIGTKKDAVPTSTNQTITP